MLLDRLLVLLLIACDEHLHDVRHGIHVAALLRRCHQACIQSDEVLDDFEGVLDGGDERLVETGSNAILGILAVDGRQRLRVERLHDTHLAHGYERVVGHLVHNFADLLGRGCLQRISFSFRFAG